MTASKPASSTTFAISLASVATTRRSQTPSSAMRRVTTMMRGSPPSGRSGLRGSRLDPSRAGITPRTGTEEDTKSVPLSLARPRLLALLPLPHVLLEHVFGRPVAVQIPEIGLYRAPSHGPSSEPDDGLVRRARALDVKYQRVAPEANRRRRAHTRLPRLLDHEYGRSAAIDGQGDTEADARQHVLAHAGIGCEDHFQARELPRSRELGDRQFRRARAVGARDDGEGAEDCCREARKHGRLRESVCSNSAEPPSRRRQGTSLVDLTTRRKFSRMRLPCSVPMDSGWNCTP